MALNTEKATTEPKQIVDKRCGEESWINLLAKKKKLILGRKMEDEDSKATKKVQKKILKMAMIRSKDRYKRRENKDTDPDTDPDKAEDAKLVEVEPRQRRWQCRGNIYE